MSNFRDGRRWVSVKTWLHLLFFRLMFLYVFTKDIDKKSGSKFLFFTRTLVPSLKNNNIDKIVNTTILFRWTTRETSKIFKTWGKTDFFSDFTTVMENFLNLFTERLSVSPIELKCFTMWVTLIGTKRRHWTSTQNLRYFLEVVKHIGLSETWKHELWTPGKFESSSLSTHDEC